MKRFLIFVCALAVAAGFSVGIVRADIVSNWMHGNWNYRDATTGETVGAIVPLFVDDDFAGKAVNTTDTWNFLGDNSGTIAASAGAGGIARMTTGAADNNADQLSTPLVFLASKYAAMEVRLAMNDVAHTAMFVGFTDAVAESAGYIAASFNAGAIVMTASDFAGFVFDTDATSVVLYGVSAKAGVCTLSAPLATLMVNGTYHIYRVEFTSATGDLNLFVDGQSVGGVTAATTITTPLCAYVGLQNRETAANTLDIDYARIWQGSTA